MSTAPRPLELKENAMFLPRAAALTALAAAATFNLATAALSHAASCDRPINGTYTATSDGQWAKTREVYHDEASVVTKWTVTSNCDDVMHCDGKVTSQLGWTEDLRCRSGQWYTSHRVDDWQPCPDGSTAPGDQSFRFSRIADAPETFTGYDRTIGPSGGCGVNLWLTVEMPFRLTATA
jgi:hypothetical protein